MSASFDAIRLLGIHNYSRCVLHRPYSSKSFAICYGRSYISIMTSLGLRADAQTSDIGFPSGSDDCQYAD